MKASVTKFMLLMAAILGALQGSMALIGGLIAAHDTSRDDIPKTPSNYAPYGKYWCGMIRGVASGKCEFSSMDRGWFRRVYEAVRDDIDTTGTTIDKDSLKKLVGYEAVMSYALICGIGWIVAALLSLVASRTEKRSLALISGIIFAVLYALFIAIFGAVWDSVRKVEDSCQALYDGCGTFHDQAIRSSREFLAYSICSFVLILAAMICSFLPAFVGETEQVATTCDKPKQTEIGSDSAFVSIIPPPTETNAGDKSSMAIPKLNSKGEDVKIGSIQIPKAEPTMEPILLTKPEPKSVPKTEPMHEYKIEPKHETKPEPIREVKPEVKVEPKVAAKVDPPREVKAEPVSQPKVEPAPPQPKAVPIPQPKVEPSPPQPKVEPSPTQPKAEAKPVTPVKIEPSKPEVKKTGPSAAALAAEYSDKFRKLNKYLADSYKMGQYAKKTFATIDSDKSGKLSLTEFKKFFVDYVARKKLPPPSDKRMEALMKKYDRDHSGSLDKAEFEKMLADAFTESRSALIRQYADAKAKMLKPAKPGPSNASGAEKMHKLLKDPIAFQGELELIAKTVDKDKNKSLNVEEVVAMLGKFCERYGLPKMKREEVTEVMSDMGRPVKEYSPYDLRLVAYAAMHISSNLAK